jgi:hypothetical protein
MGSRTIAAGKAADVSLPRVGDRDRLRRLHAPLDGPRPARLDSRMRRVSTTVLLVATLGLCCQGCFLAAAAAVGAAAYGVVSYDRNEARTDFHAGLAEVWQATLQSMRDLGYSVDLAQKPGATEGTITTGEAKVIVERHPEEFTRLRARVGTFDTEDNRRRAGLILDAVRAKVD